MCVWCVCCAWCVCVCVRVCACVWVCVLGMGLLWRGKLQLQSDSCGKHTPLTVSPQELRTRRQAVRLPQTLGQTELGDGYQYARVHYSGGQSLVRMSTPPCLPPPPSSPSVCVKGGGGRRWHEKLFPYFLNVDGVVCSLALGTGEGQMDHVQKLYSCLHCRLAHMWHALPVVWSGHRHSARAVLQLWVLHIVNWYWVDVHPN